MEDSLTTILHFFNFTNYLTQIDLGFKKRLLGF
jgi:hypothetical protein